MTSTIHQAGAPAMQDVGEKTTEKAVSFDINEAPVQLTPDSELPLKPIQPGVARIEQVTRTWDKTSLWAVFICLFLIYFNKSLDGNTTASLSPYATSSFKAHSLLPLLTIIASISAAIIYLPISKIIDIFGRAEGFVIMALFSTLGSILSASSGNVETYFAARIFKTIGNNGIEFVGTVLVSDITSLINRAFYLGLTATPYVVTTWAAPAIAQNLLETSTWRWGYGAFSVTTPVVCLPLLFFLFRSQRRAKEALTTEYGITEEEESNTHQITASNWFWEFDVIGLLLAMVGFSLTLLAVILAKYNGATWRSSHIIVMLVIGPLCIIAFVTWEKAFSPRPFLPFYLMKDRTILGACLMSTAMRIAYYIWDNYFTSYLQVVFGLSVKEAGYIDNIYSIVACGWAPILGLIVRWHGRYKLIALIAIPVHLLGAGLMIRFREQGTSIGLICLCQILIALGGGTLNNMEEIAIMANSPHQNLASVLAFKAFFAYMGSAMGSAISGAVWNSLMPQKLGRHLGGEGGMSEKEIKAIFASLKTQLSYKMGSPQRQAIISAYEDTQLVMTITSTVIVVIASVFVFVWRDLKLRDVKQVPGRVL